MTPTVSSSLPFATDFMLEVIQSASEAPFGTVGWSEINRSAARWLRPDTEAGFIKGGADSSRLGHALVADMVEQGLLDADLTTTRDGHPLVERIHHPRVFGIDWGRRLAA